MCVCTWEVTSLADMQQASQAADKPCGWGTGWLNGWRGVAQAGCSSLWVCVTCSFVCVSGTECSLSPALCVCVCVCSPPSDSAGCTAMPRKKARAVTQDDDNDAAPAATEEDCHDDDVSAPPTKRRRNSSGRSTAVKHVCMWRDVKTREVCGKSFTRAFDLHRHVRAVHEKARDYVCEWKDAASGAVCGRSFGRSGNLRTHIRTVHEKARPLVCEWKDPTTGTMCGKSFGQSGHLSKHVRTVHEKAPPFVCELKHPTLGAACGKSFGQRGHLTKHIKSVHHKSDDDMHPLDISGCESQCLTSDHVDMVEILSNPGPTKLWEYVDDWETPSTGEATWREV